MTAQTSPTTKQAMSSVLYSGDLRAGAASMLLPALPALLALQALEERCNTSKEADFASSQDDLSVKPGVLSFCLCFHCM
ncbi:hypothetical protein IPL68_05195 [Candidatus Saccharibacteria bacterium]|nr:MAG: hypothetical protein IPL68_05195 [Candidatus Saccharibacteria bacterium]